MLSWCSNLRGSDTKKASDCGRTCKIRSTSLRTGYSGLAVYLPIRKIRQGFQIQTVHGR